MWKDLINVILVYFVGRYLAHLSCLLCIVGSYGTLCMPFYVLWWLQGPSEDRG